MSKDLRYARVFFSHIESKFSSDQIERKLNQNKSKIRYYVGQGLDAQYVPNIAFEFDKKYAKSARIEDLLNKVKKNK